MTPSTTSDGQQQKPATVWVYVNRFFALIVMLIGLYLLGGGIWLIALGGSWYYLAAGGVYLWAGLMLWQLQVRGAWLMALFTVLTLFWALWESGADYWALFPRVLMPVGLAALALLLTATVQPAGSQRRNLFKLGVVALVVAIAQLAWGFVPHGVITPAADAAFGLPTADNQPSDWFAYGRTTAGTRYAPFNQINRDNVGQLKLAWTVHTGDMGQDADVVAPPGPIPVDKGPGVDQNTPLQIGDTVYSCSPHDHVTAIDADTGAVRWTHDAKASSPIWQRCRGLGYYDVAAAAKAQGSAPPPGCAQRIFNSTIDARLIALDAHTGRPCEDFGGHGTVDLKQGMGEVLPGLYFQTSAPTVARGRVIIGGWVLDNLMRGEPSGVIRAFDAVTGKLDWAWDMGNPQLTGLPPAGHSYTRGTPNMWTTAAYDDNLGLIYAPLGNETPDYFGMGRNPVSNAYNSSVVALDVVTGRLHWKFQTVHHDVWDYDLPSQPALFDLPDGNGATTPALLQATKRGQLFLLNRATGQPMAKVIEKPVSVQGAVPEERMSPTQPYSVGMPTIGAAYLTEHKIWGATMLDQLMCRIQFKRLRYVGDFTPPGLTPGIEQPGNVGGMNWGSVSYDPVNHLAFVNDIRVPSLLWQVPRSEYPKTEKRYPPATDGHGPSPQIGTPYGMVTLFWLSPVGAPCVEPPFGTITAINMDTRKIQWQVPAGTSERLGPFGLASHLPMPMGMPAYAGTMTTAGGLVFFAGTQDYYLRAFDEQTGKEIWKYPLPIGSSATPMSYVSPATGKQYIVLAVGGSAHSSQIGDYVMAWTLPDTHQ